MIHPTNADRCRCYGRRNKGRELARQKALKARYPPGWLAAKRREYWARLRAKTLAAYGGVCACCGEHRYPFLAIDHTIPGQGKIDRIRFPPGSMKFFHYLLEERREGYRVLCHNCNSALGFYGFCPHDLEAEQQRLSEE